MNFFAEHKLVINIIFLPIWIFLAYKNYVSGNYKLKKLLIPILLIIACLLNIYDIYKNK